MNDAAVMARLMDARTLLSRAAVTMDEGEAKARVCTARSALGDAIDQLHSDAETQRVLGHLEVIADALAAPGSEAA